MKVIRLSIAKSVVWSAAVLLTAALTIAACDQALQVEVPGSADSDTGSLRVAIGSVEGLSLVPDISMDIAYYEISGDGPTQQSFNLETGDSPVVVHELRVGAWSLTVDAYNETDDRIGTGTVAVTVEAGVVRGVSVTVRPLTGPGTLELEVSWLEELVTTPEVSGRLIAPDRSERVLSFEAVTEGSAEFADDGIDAGYYTLALQLRDDESVVAGAVQSVRIAEGARTHGSYSFTEIDETGSGGVDIVITPELDDPLVVSIQGGATSLTAGDAMSVRAETENAGGQEVFYSWYLNGDLAANGRTAEIGAELNTGTYRLDLIAFTSDGRRSGSAAHSFTVLNGGAGNGAEYQFIDTFEASSIETDLWRIGNWTELGGQTGAERVSLQDNNLVLAFEYDTEYYGETGNYRSSTVLTRRSDFGYGRWEARVRPTGEAGVLPAIYTLAWREDGTRQIVDLEFTAPEDGSGSHAVQFAVHDSGVESWETTVPLWFDPAEEFRVWGFEITPERVQWFVDGTVLYEYRYEEQPIEVYVPHHFKLDLRSAASSRVEATNPTEPMPDTEFSYHIDWVRFTPYE